MLLLKKHFRNPVEIPVLLGKVSIIRENQPCSPDTQRTSMNPRKITKKMREKVKSVMSSCRFCRT